MNSNFYSDNLFETFRGIARYIEASTRLDGIRVTGLPLEEADSGVITVEFRDPDYSACTLTVEARPAIEQHKPSIFLDNAGNRWGAVRVRCQVSWPSFCTATDGQGERRVALMARVLKLAADIEHVYGAVYHRLLATAEQIRATREADDRFATHAWYKSLVLENSHGLKVGQARDALGCLPAGYSPLPGDVSDVVFARVHGGREMRYRIDRITADRVRFVRVA